jgi:hypothetical protein
MSSTATLLGSLGRAVSSAKARTADRVQTLENSWAAEFAAEQTRGLVRQVFIPGWPRPARQVVFSGVDDGDGVETVCGRVALELARQVPARICMVEAQQGIGSAKLVRDPAEEPDLGIPGQRIAKNLWLIPPEDFLGCAEDEASIFRMRDRLVELRRCFEYAVIHAAPALHHGITALLAHVADGVVLVVNAGETRKIAAQKAKAVLQTANARLLGTVLNRRTFPIPERLYRRF